jgi:hypothetical protein
MELTVRGKNLEITDAAFLCRKTHRQDSEIL